jgi:hypothetical protein
MINSFELNLQTSLCDEACVLVLMAVIEGKGRPCPLIFCSCLGFEKHLFLVISFKKALFSFEKKKMGGKTESAIYGNVLSSQIDKK